MFRTARPILHLSPGASLASSLSRRNAPTAASKLLRRASRPVTWSVVRFASSDSNSRGKDKDKPENPPPPKQPIDREHEMKVAQEKLKPRPDEVSSQSSVRHVLEGSGQSNTPEPASLSTGLKHDIVRNQRMACLDCSTPVYHVPANTALIRRALYEIPSASRGFPKSLTSWASPARSPTSQHPSRPSSSPGTSPSRSPQGTASTTPSSSPTTRRITCSASLSHCSSATAPSSFPFSARSIG